MREPKNLYVLPLFLILSSCMGHHTTDDQLIKTFQQNRGLFEELARDSTSEHINCPYINDPDICVPKDAGELQGKFKRALSVPIESIYIKRKLNGSLWLPVETYGVLSTGSETRGYVYCACSLAPTTKDTRDSPPDNGIWYRPISDGWMLFVAR
jgi:hypothetical protein